MAENDRDTQGSQDAGENGQQQGPTSSSADKSNASRNTQRKNSGNSEKSSMPKNPKDLAKAGASKAAGKASEKATQSQAVQKTKKMAENARYAAKAVASAAKGALAAAKTLIATAKIWVPVVLVAGLLVAGGIAMFAAYQTIGRQDPTDLCADINESLNEGSSFFTGGGNADIESGEMGENLVIPGDYRDALERASSTYQIPVEILAAQIQQESGWDPKAYSHVGAMGLTQFMPGTWPAYGEGPGNHSDRHTTPPVGVWNPDNAIDAQGRFMGELRDMFEPHFDDEEELYMAMLAGYNAGPGAVQNFNYDLDALLNHGNPNDINSYAGQTGPYVEIIMETAGLDLTITSAGTSECFTGTNKTAIAEAALDAAWPWDERENSYTTCVGPEAGECGWEQNTPEMTELFEQAYQHSLDYYKNYTADCGRWAAAVIIGTGTDTDFPWGPTGAQLNHVQNSSQWDEIEGPALVQDLEQMEPGDFLITDGHVMIYVGEADPDGEPSFAHASISSSLAGGYGRTAHIESVSRVAGWETRSYYVFRAVGASDAEYSASGGNSPNIPANQLGDGAHPMGSQNYNATSGYGPRDRPCPECSAYHRGFDMSAPQGTNIYAAIDGTVVSAGWLSATAGYSVVIDHGHGVRTQYLHMHANPTSRGWASAGDEVSAGDKIGEVGTTGASTGDHLHFSLLYNPSGTPTHNDNIDPAAAMRQLGVTFKPCTDLSQPTCG